MDLVGGLFSLLLLSLAFGRSCGSFVHSLVWPSKFARSSKKEETDRYVSFE